MAIGDKRWIDRQAEVADETSVVVAYDSALPSEELATNLSHLARSSHVRLRIIDLHIVPYGLPLDKPAVLAEHLRERLEDLAQRTNIPVSAEIVYARDWESGLRTVLGPKSLVLLAVKRSWWRIRRNRLADGLRKLGHRVMWVGCD
jgi:hypothetical protein